MNRWQQHGNGELETGAGMAYLEAACSGHHHPLGGPGTPGSDRCDGIAAVAPPELEDSRGGGHRPNPPLGTYVVLDGLDATTTVQPNAATDSLPLFEVQDEETAFQSFDALQCLCASTASGQFPKQRGTGYFGSRQPA